MYACVVHPCCMHGSLFCRHTKHRLVNYNYLGNIAPFLSSSMMTLLAIEPTIFSLEG